MKEGIFVCLQVEQLFENLDFKNKLNAAHRRACVAFQNVCSRFLGKEKKN